MRKKLLLGNWKMNKTPEEAKAFALASKDVVDFALAHNVDIGVAPTFVCLATVLENRHPGLIVSAQNVNEHDHGAYTGEISADMLADAGAKYCIVGHSERREYHHESDALVNEKAKALLNKGIIPIICVGESLEQREKNLTMEYIAYQVCAALSGIDGTQVRRCVIAYEPIWAIGTGKTATAEQAEEVCCEIRAVIRRLYGARSARAVSILYGGSMNAKNAAELLAQPDIDGGLIGGASLKPVDFATIVAATAQE